VAKPLKNVQDISSPSTVNTGIVGLAVQAGLVGVIQDLVTFGMGDKEILLELKEVLEEAQKWALQPGGEHELHPKLNPTVITEIVSSLAEGAIYAALKLDLIRLLVEYASREVAAPAMPVALLPETTSAAGPDDVTAVRAGMYDVEITFSPPPTVEEHYEVYVNMRRSLVGDDPPDGGDGLIHLTIQVPTRVDEGINYSIRVLYGNTDEHSQTLFSDPVYLLAS
jgi:hypothetical protein